jgi:hypothetical protein
MTETICPYCHKEMEEDLCICIECELKINENYEKIVQEFHPRIYKEYVRYKAVFEPYFRTRLLAPYAR